MSKLLICSVVIDWAIFRVYEDCSVERAFAGTRWEPFPLVKFLGLLDKPTWRIRMIIDSHSLLAWALTSSLDR